MHASSSLHPRVAVLALASHGKASQRERRRRAAAATEVFVAPSKLPTATTATTWTTPTTPTAPPSLFSRNPNKALLPPGFTAPPLLTPQEEEELRKRQEQEGERWKSPSSSSATETEAAAASSSLSSPSPNPSSPLPATLPRHVGIILDGNTRWARRRGLPARAGHAAGALALARAVACCRAWGVGRLTVFAFSSENWRRPRAHVASVLAVARRAARELSPALAEAGVRVRFVGDRGSLPKSLVEACEAAEAATASREEEGGEKEKGMLLTVALAYGARADAAAAARVLAAACIAGELDPESIDERTFASALSTASGGGGGGNDDDDGGGGGAAGGGDDDDDVDLLIRTAGERRLSNFLLLESAYAELVFLEELWPDVGAEELRGAVREFMSRERRFGGTSG